MEIVHTPVLLNECLNYLSPLGESFDSTLGEGGHSNAFLSKFPTLHILGLDADPVIQEKAKVRLSKFGDRIKFYRGWSNDFYASYPEDLEKPDLILFDLGISVFHYEESQRGFSFRYDEKLDMRINPDSPVSAEDFVNTEREENLADIIYKYSEERYSRRIAHAITEYRKNARITSSKVLADVIYHAVPAEYRHGAIHPATKTFQAIRIKVNGELEKLLKLLEDAFECLKTGGKMGVITFHSLEDRIVKNYFRDLAKKCICPPEVPVCKCRGKPAVELLTRKPVCPTEEEIKENSPSRSAKLRVVRKII